MPGAPPPVLCEVVRSGFTESRHRGALVLLGAGGEEELALGDVAAPCFPRSSLKPLQAAALLQAGFAGGDDALALASASHSGEDVHVAVVREVLAAARLGESALACPPATGRLAPPGAPADRVHHNCSGKHAAMLATAVARGWPPAGYLDPAHPVQVAVQAGVESLCGEAAAAVGVDGCGAPQFAVGLRALAGAFRRLALAPPVSAPGRVAAAMRARPRLVGGTGRDVTELMAGVPGLVAKDGAEGVYAASLPDGRAMAVKVEDGAMRAIAPVLAGVLRRWGCDGPAIERWSAVPVEGGGRVVGAVRLAPGVLAL